MSAKIHPTAIVEDGAEIGEGVEIGPFCLVGPKAKLRDRVRLISQVTIAGDVEVGEDTMVYPFAVLGHPPQDFKYKGEDTRLIIGKRNVIREHATMHPGTGFGRGETRVGDDGFFMVGAHVAHDCIVGDRVVFANNATLGGSTVVGDHVIMGGLAAAHQYSRIGRHAFVGGLSAVVGDVIPYGSVFGVHAHLSGLNVIGLKRRGFARDTIRELRAAYRLLFAAEGTFQERVDDVARLFSNNAPVMEIIDFIRADASRPICLPND
ncbi:MAG: acyl-ACP--UDP-N-acetylglucosamine O-acyltransferase [Maricaulaceae bacterium]|nr:acyl-ACP--UDP-N-acetylglucosamine O-acyltransferase [Maricaulaceae bacterium]